MERLTQGTILFGDSEKQLYYNRLREYEDTGLTPEEIMDGKMLTGWILVEERLPGPSEFRGFSESGGYMKRLEVAYMTDTIEYTFGYFDGCKWMDKRHEKINNVIAWKIHEPFKPQN